MKRYQRNNGVRMALALGFSSLFAGCGSKTDEPFENQLRKSLETAQPGDIIEIPAGQFSFDRSLVLSTDNVTIKGAGMEETILSFKNQVAGAEGISVSASDFTIENLAIEDTIGDALKINEGNNIIVRGVRTEWTNGPDVNNGAYGIYPVQTTNTLLEGNVAIAASDAGIYVGQSRNVIVRNNTAEYNVAGIEIENTIGADVYGNKAINNTGGILVFNMPSIPQRGHSTRVYDNDVNQNNTENFAAPGTAVSGVPSGSGIMVNSNDQVEIFSNRIADNNTANIVISSYFSANFAGQRELADEFDPYPEAIYIYENQFQGGGTDPGFEYLQEIKQALYGDDGAFPDVIWDGITNPNNDENVKTICIMEEGVELLNIDAGNKFTNAGVNMSSHRCELPKLEAINLSS